MCKNKDCQENCRKDCGEVGCKACAHIFDDLGKDNKKMKKLLAMCQENSAKLPKLLRELLFEYRPMATGQGD